MNKTMSRKLDSMIAEADGDADELAETLADFFEDADEGDAYSMSKLIAQRLIPIGDEDEDE